MTKVTVVPNRHRGEAIIDLEDRTLLMRGTFDALAKIEDIKEGRNLRQIIIDLQNDNLSLRDLVQIVHCALVDPVPVDDLGNMLTPLGYLKIATSVLPLLEFAYLGRSIGDYPPETETPEEDVIKEPEAYPFRTVLGVAVARLQFTEETFWASTPQSFFAAIRTLSGPTEAEKKAQWHDDVAPIYEALGEKAA